jgi:hypothetical protein
LDEQANKLPAFMAQLRQQRITGMIAPPQPTQGSAWSFGVTDDQCRALDLSLICGRRNSAQQEIRSLFDGRSSPKP